MKGMIKSSLLSKDESLTPNIDKVMPVWMFIRRVKTKNGKNELLILVLDFILSPRKAFLIKTNQPNGLEAGTFGASTPIKTRLQVAKNKFRLDYSTAYFPI